MDEAELNAYRLAGGPVDTSNNPVLYFGKRGALAGHVEQLDEFIKRVPWLDLIMSFDAVVEKGKTIYSSDQAVFAAEAERELQTFAPTSAIRYMGQIRQRRLRSDALRVSTL